jgi:hypothetical protein
MMVVRDQEGMAILCLRLFHWMRLERWETKAEQAAGALKTAMSQEVKVLIRDCEDDPVIIWVLKHVLGRALESQRTKGDCREAMKTIFND